MNVAFIFSGKIRQIERSKYYWLEMKKRYNADIFCSFWEEDQNETDNIDNFIKIYNPIKYEIDTFNSVKDTMVNQLFTNVEIPKFLRPKERTIIEEHNVLYMAYKMWRVNTLTKLVNKKYDIIVRCRTDVITNPYIDLEVNDYFNLPKGLTLIRQFKNNWGFTDTISYSKPELMDYYSSFIFYFSMYIKDGCSIWSNENMLRYHLNNKKITVREMPVYVLVLRDNNKIENFNKYISIEYINHTLDPDTIKIDKDFYSYKKNYDIYNG